MRALAQLVEHRRRLHPRDDDVRALVAMLVQTDRFGTSIADALRITLTARGYEVVAAHDGAEAIDCASDLRPDIVVMDLMMPTVDGIEATARIKAAFPEIEVIAAELAWPRARITVNLAPAGLKKEGSGFDLTIALAILAASRQVPAGRVAEHVSCGELSLDGREGRRLQFELIESVLKELRYAYKVFAPYRETRKVTVFGSSRMPPTAGESVAAREFGRRMVQAGWMVVTGAGGDDQRRVTAPGGATTSVPITPP